jgi:hypothetical protein
MLPEPPTLSVEDDLKVRRGRITAAWQRLASR